MNQSLLNQLIQLAKIRCDRLDIDKSVTTPLNLSKLSNVVKNDDVEDCI